MALNKLLIFYSAIRSHWQLAKFSKSKLFSKSILLLIYFTQILFISRKTYQLILRNFAVNNFIIFLWKIKFLCPWRSSHGEEVTLIYLISGNPLSGTFIGSPASIELQQKWKVFAFWLSSALYHQGENCNWNRT